MSQSKLLGPEIGYIDIFMHQLEESLKKQHEEGKQFQRTPIRPSSAGKCAKELYFELQQYAGKARYETKPHSPETELLLNLGHAIESHLIYNLRKHFSVCEVKYTQQVLDFGTIEAVNDKRLSQHLEGSMDLAFWSKEWRCVVDVKSKGDYHDFRARKTAWDATSQKLENMTSVQTLSDRSFWVANLEDFLTELNDPFFAGNFLQLNMYANSEFLKQRGINHGAIIQYHKAKSKLREIRFLPSEKLYQDTITKFKNVVRAVDEDLPELAPTEYQPGEFKTKYCGFCVAKVPGSCAMKDKK